MSQVYREENKKLNGSLTVRTLALLALAAFVAGLLLFPAPPAEAGANQTRAVANGGELDHNRKRVPDIYAAAQGLSPREPAEGQIRALDRLRANTNDQNVTVRWDQMTGSVDVLYDFASAPSTLEPEAAARAFLAANGALFGLSDLSTVRLKSNVEALGGNLLYFEQVHNGLTVAGGGIGVVMDGQRRVRMLSGPYYGALSVDTAPALDAAAAVTAATEDLAHFSVEWTTEIAGVLNPAYDVLEAQLGAMASPHPQLNVVPSGDGGRLAYEFYLFSRNPFGFFHYQVDARTGEILGREDQVRYQQNPLPYTADIYPSSPILEDPDTGALALDENGEPRGLLRVQLRNYNPGMNLTAVEGTLVGPNALVRNVLATKLPFSQAALGTFHFRRNNAPVEAQPNERDDLAEPAEHIDGVNNFFFINYLMEYIKHLHVAGDRQHSPFGQGHFPDTFPNSDKPLVGLVHFPSDQGLIGVSGPTDTSSPDAALRSALGMDNAFSLSASQTIAGQQVVVNPTAYGHGYLFNDLAKDGPVVYHEGMHSISTPIAGLRGHPEGGGINEGQADLWAYSITEDKVLGNYVVNGWLRRARVRALGGDPDLRQWIRHADSGLTYSRLGTSGGTAFQVHRDGEIYASTMMDIRELLHLYQTGGPYKRPNFLNGAATDGIPLAKETWERLLLGQIYVLGTMDPDTFVRARDAMIVADQFLYPSDATNPDAPGQHRALIEQVFAAHEIGKNAVAPAPSGSTFGPQTISTEVSDLAASQNKLAPPAGVSVNLETPNSTRISWQPVSGALAYQILRREIGKENQRQNAPVPNRPYRDGDASTDGFLHVDYVPAGQTSYVDNGHIEGGLVRRGLSNPVAFEYVVRTLNVNANKQLGVSDKSAPASAPTAFVNVTSSVQAAISNVRFLNGKFEFDQVIKNLGAGQFDGTIFMPVEFRIVSISNPSVTVFNADNGGSGQPGSPAVYYYNQKLLQGQTSTQRRLIFSNPLAQLFTFDAVVTARVQAAPGQETRYEQPPIFPDPALFDVQTLTTVYTGRVLASDGGAQSQPGITYVDTPFFTSNERVYRLHATMTAPATPPADIDLYLLDSSGRVLAAAETGSSNEQVAANILPGQQYRYRVVGYSGAAKDFRIESREFLAIPRSTGGSSSSTSGSSLTGDSLDGGGTTLTNLVRFTVDPVSGAISMQTIR